ncbi:MAG: SoxR reducing system RseC family protein, partial [Clostridia bacterium]|nr:SoxR reducing system RseC family protein [Clostridia bacterium]
YFTDFKLAYLIGYERIPMDELCESETLWKLRSWGKYENYLDAAELIFGEQTQSVEVVAQNRAGAKTGDRVELESSTARTLFAAFSLFIVPFLITLVFYFISKEFFLSQKSFPLVLILVFCAAFFVMGKIVNGFIKKKHSIYVVRILEESKESLEAE